MANPDLLTKDSGPLGEGARAEPCCGPHAIDPCCEPDQANLAAATDAEALKAQVRTKYGEAARQVAEGAAASCCAPSACCGTDRGDPITDGLYDASEAAQLPDAAVAASLGCGNPTALATLAEGETVLDLGSGGGVDVLLSAKKVGPTGKVFGLDMTDAMIDLARANQQRADVRNVEFLKGEIEQIPLPDESVDVIISNCVINLSANKAQVLREAFRVLRPGGRVAISDVVRTREVPAAVRQSLELWLGCVAGALATEEYRQGLAAAGFEAIEIEPWRAYAVSDAREFLADSGIDVDGVAPQIDGAFMSAFIRGRKPSR